MTDEISPHFSKRRALVYSFYLKAFYVDVWRHWKGLGFTYLLMLNAMILIPVLVLGVLLLDRTMFDDQDAGHQAIASVLDSVIEQVPPMTWKHGQMHTDAKQPYAIRIAMDGGEEQDLILIDRKGKLEDLKSSKAWALLTKDAIHIKKDDKIESRFWTEIQKDEFALDARIAKEMATESKGWMAEHRMAIYTSLLLGLGGVLLVFLQIYRVVQALLYGLAAMAVSSLMKADLRYDAAVRLSSVALTPAIFIDIALLMAGAGGISMLMSIVLTMGYLIFAISAGRTRPDRADEA